MRLCLLVFLFAVIVWCSNIQPLVSGQDAVSAAEKDTEQLYTAGYLLQLGSELKSPLLRLLGLTICNVHLWSAWGEWSTCHVRSGMFGLRNRTRTLGTQDKRCPSNGKTEMDTETSLCEGLCAFGFNVTKHGYCVKYIPERVHYDVAEKRCGEVGSHVININSVQKLQDLKEMYVSFSQAIWVDGRRASVGSPWVFSHGEGPVDLTWNLGQPQNTPSELCLQYHSTDWLLHDASCTRSNLILCEKTD